VLAYAEEYERTTGPVIQAKIKRLVQDHGHAANRARSA
jgi:hypothetical protein